MFLSDFLVALLIALLLTAIFGGVLSGHRLGSVLIFFFVVLLWHMGRRGVDLPYRFSNRGGLMDLFCFGGVVFRSGLNGPDSPCKTRKETTIGSSR